MSTRQRHVIDDFIGEGVVEGAFEVDDQLVGVVGAEVQPDAEAEDGLAAGAGLLRDHLLEVAVEVLLVIGGVGGAVTGATIGDDDQQTARAFIGRGVVCET